MRKSGVTTTSAKPTTKITIDSAKARFFYQGVLALKRLQLADKSKSPSKKLASSDVRRR